MGGLFGGGAPDPPPVPPPLAIPEVGADVGEKAARAVRRRSGFRKTILTGELAPDTGKKQILG